MGCNDEAEIMQVVDRACEDSSDDDIEIVPETVNNYWLEDAESGPVSFAVLPYFKSGGIGEDGIKIGQGCPLVYLRGTQDNGLLMYNRVVTWKIELTKNVKPLFHLKTEKHWIKLLKPRKSYEKTIRSILSVAQFLNYSLSNPNEPEKAVWAHVNDTFLTWEVRPSRDDFPPHMQIVRYLMDSDKRLAGSLALQALDLGSSKKRLASMTDDGGQQSNRKRMHVLDDEDAASDIGLKTKMRNFEDDNPDSDEEMDGFGDDNDDVGDLSETVCCICDNGGIVLCCDGPCMRSFHVNKDTEGADDANCETLGYDNVNIEMMDKFYCPNCEYKQHQCYACGELGSSNDDNGGCQEVFVCDAAMCGHFYHPNCVAELILRNGTKNEQVALAETIKQGNGFICPMHKCWGCGKGEVKEEKNLQFGICRRCPRVWHRKCFPPFLKLEDENSGDEEEIEVDNEGVNAWDGLLHNRILIYCNLHTILSNLGTPERSHVRFPAAYMQKKISSKNKVELEERNMKLNKALLIKRDEPCRKLSSDQILRKTMPVPQLDSEKRASSFVGQIKPDVRQLGKNVVEKNNFMSRGLGLKSNDKPSATVLLKRPSVAVTHASKSKEDQMNDQGKFKSAAKESSSQLLQQRNKQPSNTLYTLSNEEKSVIDGIINTSKSSITMNNVLKKYNVPACYRRGNNKNPDKKFSLVKIESITKGMRKAVEIMDAGGSVEDAKLTCSPDYIKYLESCKTELRVYLSPFLHGSRYTSYGRHFTKSEKLEQIVDRLHWYMQEGDMLVDFCCGANEFSLLMKRKLEQSGKKCHFKNFDFIQTKNDFNFSKRDWFEVRQDELCDGSKLVMGLNPPFGVKGQLANQFIDHALKFRPKLIVLIVPKETERLDVKKKDKYDLVWEDADLMGGQSFYLPGSVDVNNNVLDDWNAVPPPLYLWSRPDWTPKHRMVALEKGHISLSSSTRFASSIWRPPIRSSLQVVTDPAVIKSQSSCSVLKMRGESVVSDANRSNVAIESPKLCPERISDLPSEKNSSSQIAHVPMLSGPESSIFGSQVSNIDGEGMNVKEQKPSSNTKSKVDRVSEFGKTTVTDSVNAEICKTRAVGSVSSEFVTTTVTDGVNLEFGQTRLVDSRTDLTDIEAKDNVQVSQRQVTQASKLIDIKDTSIVKRLMNVERNENLLDPQRHKAYEKFDLKKSNLMNEPNADELRVDAICKEVEPTMLKNHQKLSHSNPGNEQNNTKDGSCDHEVAQRNISMSDAPRVGHDKDTGKADNSTHENHQRKRSSEKPSRRSGGGKNSPTSNDRHRSGKRKSSDRHGLRRNEEHRERPRSTDRRDTSPQRRDSSAYVDLNVFRNDNVVDRVTHNTLEYHISHTEIARDREYLNPVIRQDHQAIYDNNSSARPVSGDNIYTLGAYGARSMAGGDIYSSHLRGGMPAIPPYNNYDNFAATRLQQQNFQQSQMIERDWQPPVAGFNRGAYPATQVNDPRLLSRSLYDNRSTRNQQTGPHRPFSPIQGRPFAPIQGRPYSGGGWIDD